VQAATQSPARLLAPFPCACIGAGTWPDLLETGSDRVAAHIECNGHRDLVPSAIVDAVVVVLMSCQTPCIFFALTR
jgi:hypothetical protein